MAEAAQRTLHVDRGLAAYSGLTAALAVATTGALCWLLGWERGSVALGIAAAGSSLFAAFDDPRPMLRKLLTWNLLATPVAGFYVFAVLPSIDGVVELLLALAPLYFVPALFLATPTYALAAIGFAIISQTLLALQPLQSNDFYAFTSAAIGSTLGTVVVLTMIGLIRVVGAPTAVRRLMRSTWHDLASLAGDVTAPTRQAWVGRAIDRIGLLLPRASQATGAMRERAAHALHDLRLGVALIELRAASTALPRSVRSAIDDAFEQVERHLHARLERPDADLEPALTAALDTAIERLTEAAPQPERTQALIAASGLRLSLAPAAPELTSPTARP